MDSNYRSSYQSHLDAMMSNTSQAFKKAGSKAAETLPKPNKKGSNEKSQASRDGESKPSNQPRTVRQGSEPDTGMKSGVSEAGAQEVRFGTSTSKKPAQ